MKPLRRNPKPVQDIEVPEQNVKSRTVLVIVLLVVAVAAIAVGLVAHFYEKPGWKTVKSQSNLDCSGDFVFAYYLPEKGLSGNTVLKGVSQAYTQACFDAYRIFNESQIYQDYGNVAYINANPNQKIAVHPTLYAALKKVDSCGDRFVYLAPIFRYYEALTRSSYDAEAEDYFPSAGSENAQFFEDVVAFANDRASVQLEFFGDNMLRLNVSEQYLHFLGDNSETCIINLYLYKNAFIADYLAVAMQSYGCKKGTISSLDGYTRCFGDDENYSAGIFDKKQDGSGVRVGDMNFVGTTSLVRYRDFPLLTDKNLYYVFQNGQTVTQYVDVATGLNKSCTSFFVAYSHSKSCADVLLSTYSIFVTDQVDTASISQLAENEIQSVYCLSQKVYHTDGLLQFSGLAEGYTTQFAR